MATMPLPRARISIAVRIENVRSVRGTIARLAAVRLLPIRSLYSRYSATKAAAMATMPLPRNVDAVTIENVRPIRGIAQTINGNFELDETIPRIIAQVGELLFSVCENRPHHGRACDALSRGR